jgi:hypothetical protein
LLAIRRLHDPPRQLSLPPRAVTLPGADQSVCAHRIAPPRLSKFSYKGQLADADGGE